MIYERTDIAPTQLAILQPVPLSEGDAAGAPCAGPSDDEALPDEATLRSLRILAGATLRVVVDKSAPRSCAVGGLATSAAVSVGAARGTAEPAEQGFEGSVLLGGGAGHGAPPTGVRVR